MPRGPVLRESTAEVSSESVSSVAWESEDDDVMSDESSPTECTDVGGMTPPKAVSQYDFDIQLGSGKRFTCRVGSREARSKWIQAIEVARSAGIPDCPLCKPTDPPDVQELTADLWPLHFPFEQWRATLVAKATAAVRTGSSSDGKALRPHKNRKTNGDGGGRTARECTRAGGDWTLDVNRGSVSEYSDARGDDSGDDGSVDNNLV